MKKIFKKLLVIGSYFWRVWLDMEKEQRLRFSIYCLQYCLRERERDRERETERERVRVCVLECVYLKTEREGEREWLSVCVLKKQTNQPTMNTHSLVLKKKLLTCGHGHDVWTQEHLDAASWLVPNLDVHIHLRVWPGLFYSRLSLDAGEMARLERTPWLPN